MCNQRQAKGVSSAEYILQRGTASGNGVFPCLFPRLGKAVSKLYREKIDQLQAAEQRLLEQKAEAQRAARALAEKSGFPIVSSSANISGRKAVTAASELDPELLLSLMPETDGVLDEPPAPGGGEASTIVEPLGSRNLRLLREGALPLADLWQAGFHILNPHSEVHA